MTDPVTHAILAKLAGLRTELVDQAFTFDVRGSCAAADVAMATAARLDELCAELTPPNRDAGHNPIAPVRSRVDPLPPLDPCHAPHSLDFTRRDHRHGTRTYPVKPSAGVSDSEFSPRISPTMKSVANPTTEHSAAVHS